MHPLVAQANELLARVPSPSILVGFSGGKDSIATLDLAVKRFPRVEAFFMYLVKDLRVEEEMLRHVLARFPKVKLHRVPHFELSGYLRQNVFECNPAGVKVQKLDLAKIEADLRARTGIEWFAYGERCADSIVRNAKLKKIGGIWPKFRRVYPIYRWKNADVPAYLRTQKLPVPKLIGGRRFSGAVALTPKELLWLRENYPDDFATVCRKFPLAPAAVFRWEHGLAPDRRGNFHVRPQEGREARPAAG